VTAVAGPYFEDLEIGDVFDTAPAVTLTEGHLALHQAIVGGRLRLALDVGLARAVLGSDSAMAPPGLVCDVAIGQSTVVTQRVVANLFYRGLMLHRAPVIGDTLATTTEVVALRQTSGRPGRAATGLAALRMRTVDQEDRPVLDFVRCAMLPLADPDGQTGRADDLDEIDAELDADAVGAFVSGWDLDAFGNAVGGPRFADLDAGTTWEIEGADVVTSAPELARLSLNIAIVHHDGTRAPGGERLVYGGHTIGIAATQATRALPNLLTIAAWHSCDHVGPVREEDLLTSVLELERAEPLPGGGGLLHLRSRVKARQGDGEETDVLDWRFVGVMA
jgi:acyl dehydratase